MAMVTKTIPMIIKQRSRPPAPPTRWWSRSAASYPLQSPAFSLYFYDVTICGWLTSFQFYKKSWKFFTWLSFNRMWTVKRSELKSDQVKPGQYLTKRGGPAIDLIHKSEILVILSANDLLATPVCNRSDQSVVVCQQVAVKPFCILDIFQD